MVGWLIQFAKIHWFSIFNSFMMVIFLTGLVSMILMRTLRKDYAKYSKDDDDLEDVSTISRFKLASGGREGRPFTLIIYVGQRCRR